MALKKDRIAAVGLDTIQFFCNQETERGCIATISTVASGVANDNASNVVAFPLNPSGTVPVGMLVNDVVNLDLTRQHKNWYKDEVQLGGKVTLVRQGEFTTNLIVSGVTPTAGATAFVGAYGWLTSTDAGGNPPVGHFVTTKDEDGFAKVVINIPMYK